MIGRARRLGGYHVLLEPPAAVCIARGSKKKRCGVLRAGCIDALLDMVLSGPDIMFCIVQRSIIYDRDVHPNR